MINSHEYTYDDSVVENYPEYQLIEVSSRELDDRGIAYLKLIDES